MINCPRGCSRPFVDELELYRHLRDTHRIPDYEARRLAGVGAETNASGWFEGQRETPTGKKAIEHQIAAAKALAASRNTLTVPFQPIKVKPEVTIQDGWKKTSTGYSYERKVIEEHTIDNIITRIMRGEIVGEHGSLTLWTYDKDISELNEQQDKAGILKAKLPAYAPHSDPEFLTIAAELQDLTFKINKAKQEITPTKFQELMLEEHYQGENIMGEGDYEKWVSEFMQKCNNETESVIKELKSKKDDPIVLK